MKIKIILLALLVGLGFSLSAQTADKRDRKKNLTIKEYKLKTGSKTPRLDDITRYAVLAYILVSCLSLAAAAGLHLPNRFARILFIAGIASLLFSDLLIAQKRFLHDGTLYILMMPTYFASQILVTAAIIRLKPLYFIP